MKRVFKQHQFTFTFDTVFREVIGNCQASPRPGQSGTWITEEMKEAYIKLHEMGYAHSVESWQNGKLAGGLYGVSLGGAFFGESMFSRVNNASKAALIHLCRKLEEKGFHFLDAQVYTPHMEKLGAEYIPRSEFQDLLEKAMKSPTVKGSWKDWV
jgi:leucyl/phenylalanyl-tRNA--protein transferase